MKASCGNLNESRRLEAPEIEALELASKRFKTPENA